MICVEIAERRARSRYHSAAQRTSDEVDQFIFYLCSQPCCVLFHFDIFLTLRRHAIPILYVLV